MFNTHEVGHTLYYIEDFEYKVRCSKELSPLLYSQ